MPENQAHIMVLMGGLSSEREISLLTGKSISNALLQQGYQVTNLDWKPETNIISSLLSNPVDKVFIALHGKGGEDGTIQGVLNTLSCPYTGPGVTATAILLDKILTKDLLLKNNFLTPAYLPINSSVNPEQVIASLGLPLVIKPVAEGSSKGITLVKHAFEFMPAFADANQYGCGVIAEQFLHGQELTLAIIDDWVLPSVRVDTNLPGTGIYDYHLKYEEYRATYHIPGSNIDQKLQDTCRRFYQYLGCRGVVSFNGILTEQEEFYLLDINAIPGMTENSLVPKIAAKAGISFAELAHKLACLADYDRC